MTICDRFDLAVVLFPFIDRARAVRFKLFTLENGIIARRIGRLSRADSTKVKAGLKRCLGR